MIDLNPLWEAGAVIVFHTSTALLSLIMGIYILVRPKGTTEHIWLGRGWIVAMLGVVASSFMIFETRLIGPFSPIHLLSLLTLWGLYSGWTAARKQQRKNHATSMIMLWLGALGLNVWFTLLPGRTLHKVIFGANGWG